MIIKAILFDLDGVLVDACDWHYYSLNRALEEVVGFSIDRKDHEIKYNGLPTTVKLNMLELKEEDIERVWKLKQEYTLDAIKEYGKIQNEKIELFNYLIDKNIKLACVTNSIQKTTKAMLKSTGQFEYFDIIVTNEDVKKNKPYPDCYNFAVEKLNVDPNYCIIVEDSEKGIESAKKSKVPNENIWVVDNSEVVNLKNFLIR